MGILHRTYHGAEENVVAFAVPANICRDDFSEVRSAYKHAPVPLFRLHSEEFHFGLLRVAEVVHDDIAKIFVAAAIKRLYKDYHSDEDTFSMRREYATLRPSHVRSLEYKQAHGEK